MSFQCPLCPTNEDSITFLHVHCMTIHRHDFVSCPWCALPFSNVRMLQKHAIKCRQFNDNEPRECDIKAFYIQNNRCAPCESQFASNEAAIKHYKEHHLNYRYVCEKCERCFEVYKNWNDHYAEGHPIPIISAKVSKTTTTSQTMSPSPTEKKEFASSLVSDQPHSTSFHQRPKKILSQLTEKQKNLFRYAFQTMRCHECKVKFPSITETAKHIKTDHKTRVYPCSECNHMYMSPNNRERHRCAKQSSTTRKNNRCQCGFKHSGECAKSPRKPETPLKGRSPREPETSMEVGAEVIIPVDMIKTEPIDDVRVRPATYEIEAFVDLISDSDSESEWL